VRSPSSSASERKPGRTVNVVVATTGSLLPPFVHTAVDSVSATKPDPGANSRSGVRSAQVIGSPVQAWSSTTISSQPPSSTTVTVRSTCSDSTPAPSPTVTSSRNGSAAHPTSHPIMPPPLGFDAAPLPTIRRSGTARRRRTVARRASGTAAG
jgi:hypothetical protein